MGNRIELLDGPCRPDKGEALVELCLERIRAGRESSFMLIVPSPQRAAQVTDRLLDATTHGLFKPFVGTFNELIRALYQMLGGRGAPVSASVKAVLIQDILSSDPAAFPYLHGRADEEPFAGLVAHLCELVAKLKRSLIHPDDFDHKARKLPALRTPKGRELAKLYRRYQERLQQHDLVDGDGVFWLLIERLAAGQQLDALGQLDLLLLDGIHDLTVAEWRVLEGLIAHMDRTVAAVDYWPEAGPLGHAAKAFHDQLVGQGGRAAAASSPEPTGLAAATECDLFAKPSQLAKPWPCRDALSVWRCGDRQDEVKSIASQIKRMAQREPDLDLTRVCVSFPTLGPYTRLVREIFRRYGIPFDIAGGLPLAQAPVAAAAMGVLRAVIDGYPRRGVVNVLRSPYVRFAAEAGGDALDAGELDWLSREASVIRGRDAWTQQIEAYAQELRGEVAGAESLPSDGERGGAGARLAAKQRWAQRAERALPAVRELMGTLSQLEGEHEPEEFRSRLGAVLSRLQFQQRIMAGCAAGLQPSDVRRDTVAFDRFWRCVDSVLFSVRFSTRKTYSLAQLHDMLASALAETSYRPERRGQGVPVVSLRDTRALDVDRLFVGGLVEREFPRLRGQDIFLAESVQAQLGVKTEPAVEAEDRYLFYHALVQPRAGVWLSWPATTDGQDALRSPFIDEICRITDVEEDAPALADAPMTAADLQVRMGQTLVQAAAPASALDAFVGWAADEPALARNVVRSLRIRDERANAAQLSTFQGDLGADRMARAGIELWSDARHFTFRHFEDYGLCPFAFFMKSLLRLVEPEEPSEELSALTRGDVMHEILRQYYTERRADGHAGLGPEDDFDAARAHIKRVAEQRLAPLAREGLFWEAEREAILGSDERPGLLDGFIRCEMDDPTRCEPAFFEVAFGSLSHADSTDDALRLPALELECGDAAAVAIIGKIDRIDLSPARGFVVLDYKTGAAVLGEREVLEGVHFQITIYIMAVANAKRDEWRPVGGAYYRIRNVKDLGKESPILAKDMLEDYYGEPKKRRGEDAKPDLDALLGACQEWIETYARWIREGKFPPMCHARNRACLGWCPYRTICRVDPARMTGDKIVNALRGADSASERKEG